jgi:hypothetical protein
MKNAIPSMYFHEDILIYKPPVRGNESTPAYKTPDNPHAAIVPVRTDLYSPKPDPTESASHAPNPKQTPTFTS